MGNPETQRLKDALQQAVGWIEECGSDHEGRQFVLTEARSALKGMTAVAAEWQPIETAPKDGTIIDLTWIEGGSPQEIWPMQWAHIQRNGLFPGKVGMWTAPDGSITWDDSNPDGAPTHWRKHQRLA